MEFIDLFAGLGGFHLALRELGHQCVFACEIDDRLRSLYKKNFEMESKGDIRKVDIQNEIPKHDVLCAGFPCQPFSVAGHRKGLADLDRGNLFKFIVDVLRIKKPRYFILENVPHLKGHNGGQTWRKIQEDLRNVDCQGNVEYQIDERCFSPHQFGIPQVRWRMFIIGSRVGDLCFPEPPDNVETNIQKILDKNPPEARKLTEQETKCLTAWQNFLKLFPDDVELPSVPIWSREFGATYPVEETTPHVLGVDKLRELDYQGSYGTSLKDLDNDKAWENLPAYAKREQNKFPPWKVQFIEQNRTFYKRHENLIKEWIPQISGLPRSCQKFEWNCKGEERDIWKLIIQFRGSGVRARKPQTAPTLTARCAEVPIIGWEKRYMTPRECARLQSIEGIDLPQPDSRAFKALGNAVNVEIVKRIAEALTSTQKSSQQLYLANVVPTTNTEIKMLYASTDTRIEHHEQTTEG